MPTDDNGRDIDSITLEECRAALDADGSAHLVFYGAGGGAIAFGVSLKTIGALRRELRIAEDHLERHSS
jgi:hypothetical protein